MRNLRLSISSAVLVVVFLFQIVAFAASAPPSYEQRVERVAPTEVVDITAAHNQRAERPVITDKAIPSYSSPVVISFEDDRITIPLSVYGRNTPYKAYYTIESDGEGDPLISIENVCDSGLQIYGMTDEEDSRGKYIAIYPYSLGEDRLILKSQKDDGISDTLYISIVDSINSISSTNSPGKEYIRSDDTYIDVSVEDKVYYEEEVKTEEKVNLQPAFTDVGTEHEFYNAILTLKVCGILSGYPDGRFQPYSEISRAEVCAMIISTIADKDDISVNSHFNDVPTNHWAFDYIGKAKAIGIINGVDSYNFAPDDDITDEQLIKILVCLLGYGKNAPYIGGYPNGYIEIASDIGLLDNAGYQVGNKTNRGTVAQIIFNALSIYNAGEFEFIDLPQLDNTSNLKEETVNDKPKKEVYEGSDQTTSTNNQGRYEDEILTEIKGSINYLSDDDAVVVAEFIKKSLEKGWDKTTDEIMNISNKYPNEALLEQMSDIYNKLKLN